MVKKAVILCGGMATRFMPISKSIPKEMFPILNKPVVQYLIEDLAKSGITDIMIIIGRNKECLVNHFDRNVELEDRLNLTKKINILEEVKKTETLANISFTRQIVAKGTGHAILKAKNFVGDEPFAMLFGDDMFYNPTLPLAKQLIDTFNAYGKSTIGICTVRDEDIPKFGILDLKKEKDNVYKVNRLVEKPQLKDAPSNYCYIGSSVLTKDIFNYIENLPQDSLEIGVAEALNNMAKDGKVMGLEPIGKRLDCGSVEGFVEANIFMALQDPKYKDIIKNYIKDIK